MQLSNKYAEVKLIQGTHHAITKRFRTKTCKILLRVAERRYEMDKMGIPLETRKQMQELSDEDYKREINKIRNSAG